MKTKILTAIVFVCVAAATANWLDYAFFQQKGYGYPALLWIALAGCVLFGVGCLALFVNYRVGIVFGVIAALLSWPYFGLLAYNMKWRDLPWLLRIHYHGTDQALAVSLLVIATTYLLAQLLLTSRSLVREKGTA